MRETVVGRSLALVTAFLPAYACDDGEVVYNVTINQGPTIQRDVPTVDVPLDLAPKPYPYATDPFPFGDTSTYSSIAAGWNHVCAVRLDGVVECRGADAHGETYPPTGQFTTVAAGYEGTCGRRTTGDWECWGFDPAFSDWTRPGGADWPAGVTLLNLSIGRRGICGLDSAGTPSCWAGYASAIESPPAQVSLDGLSVGVGAVCGVETATSNVVCWGNNSVSQQSVPAGTWSSVSFSVGTPCGVRTDGSITCWGDDSPRFMEEPPAGRDFVDVEVKGDHICGLHQAGEISCFSKAHGRWRSYDGPFVEMAVGQTFVCGRDVSGYIQCMGMLPEPAPAGN